MEDSSVFYANILFGNNRLLFGLEAVLSGYIRGFLIHFGLNSVWIPGFIYPVILCILLLRPILRYSLLLKAVYRRQLSRYSLGISFLLFHPQFPIIINPSTFFILDMMLPVITLLVIILVHHGYLFMFSSTYFFDVFSLAVRIAALYFCRLFRKAFCVLSLIP